MDIGTKCHVFSLIKAASTQVDNSENYIPVIKATKRKLLFKLLRRTIMDSYSHQELPPEIKSLLHELDILLMKDNDKDIEWYIFELMLNAIFRP